MWSEIQTSVAPSAQESHASSLQLGVWIVADNKSHIFIQPSLIHKKTQQKLKEKNTFFPMLSSARKNWQQPNYPVVERSKQILQPRLSC